MSKPRQISRSHSARRDSRATIGVIGLGLMGSALAKSLMRGGFKVSGWDTDSTKARALSSAGGKAASNAAEVLAGCQRVLLSLPDHNAVKEVLRGMEAWRANQLIIDTSTGDPEEAAKLGGQLKRKGVQYLDATISGNSSQLSSRDVIVMVGGRKESVARCKDLFACFARRSFHIGPCGSGTRMKLVTNLVLGLNRAALAEGLAFAKALGLDLIQTLSVLRASPAYSRILDSKGAKMISADFEPQAYLSQHLKDVKLMLAAAARAGLKLPLSKTHRKLLEAAEAAGLGQLDNSAIIRVFVKNSSAHSRK